MASASPILSLIAAGLALVGLVGAYTGAIPPMAGFQTFVAGTLLGGFFCAVLALIGLYLSRDGRDPEGRSRAMIGLAIALGLLIAVLGAASTGGSAPPINDITTDLEEPPAFAAPDEVPEYRGRDMRYPPEFEAVIRAHYPTLTSLRLDTAAADIFPRAVAEVNALGWEVLGENGSLGTIYAKDETPLFRFVDDVVIRIRPDGTGSRIDMRSKSRDGRGDLGANAARINQFFEALSAR